jgi:hypothetical protein
MLQKVLVQLNTTARLYHLQKHHFITFICNGHLKSDPYIPPPAQFPSSPKPLTLLSFLAKQNTVSSSAEVTVPQEPRISIIKPGFIPSKLSINTDGTYTIRIE